MGAVVVAFGSLRTPSSELRQRTAVMNQRPLVKCNSFRNRQGLSVGPFVPNPSFASSRFPLPAITAIKLPILEGKACGFPQYWLALLNLQLAFRLSYGSL